MHKIFYLVALILCLTNSVCFADVKISKDASVAIMDFGTRPGASSAEINIHNAGKSSCDYIITRLINRGCFNTVDKDFAFNKIQAEGLNTVGLIDPDTAKRIGEILNVNYIIYGNISNVSVSDTGTQILGNIGGGVNVCTVKAHIIARLMDVNSGDIVMVAKGEGNSKSSFVEVDTGSSLLNVNVVKIGTNTVTMDSVHNSIQKASYDTVDDLIFRLYGEKKPK